MFNEATTILWLVIVPSASMSGAGNETFAATAAEEHGGESSPEIPASAQRPTRGDGLAFQLVPRGDPYPPYVADPRRAGFGILRMSYSGTEIPDSGVQRFGLKLGSRFGLFRLQSGARPGRCLQVGIEAGFHGQFSVDRSYDNVGWDGIYGLVATFRPRDRLAFKLGTLHTSSHVGDEYAERTGRRRIGYTRHELVAGVHWPINDRWRSYTEAGWGYELRNRKLQEPGRLQLGVEYESAWTFWGNRLRWYAAADSAATEERDWKISATLQVGLVLQDTERRWRLGLEHYDGRSLLGEFFRDDEIYTALGLWLDL